MPYQYETHLHTKESSACASASGKEMAQAHKRLGYTGIFVTDHLTKANGRIPKNGTWKEKIEAFCLGYENTREEGEKIGLDVFFGFEYAVAGADFLVYNLNKDWLLQHENFWDLEPRDVFRMIHQDGGFIVHGHPFRERFYIDHIRLYPREIDGVEVINGAQFEMPEMNERAAIYAAMYDLPVTAGSDSHHLEKLFGTGIRTEKRLEKATDYLTIMKERKLELIV